MSLNNIPIKTVEVLDPITRLNNVRTFDILRGGNEVSYQEHIATSASVSNIQLNANPPSQSTIIDRNCYVKTTWTLRFTAVGAAPVGTLLKLGIDDGLRCQPFSNIVQTVTAQIGNDTVSTNLNSYLSAFQRYANDDSVQDVYSTSPQMPDSMFDLSDYAIYGQAKNPLALHAENSAQEPRGGFVYDSVTDTAGAGAAVVQVTLVEPFYLSPFLFGGADESGLIGVSTLSLNWVLDANKDRMWSKTSNSNAYTMVAELVSASCIFKYITPNLTSELPASISYPYSEVFPIPNKDQAINAGATQDFIMSSYQLNSIPTRMYVYVRRRNQDITSETTDTFLSINKVEVNFGNRTGILSSATKHDLYYMSKRNGCNLTFPEWNKYVGSVLCINFGTDIGLSPIECPGLLQNTQLSVKVSATNQTGANMNAILQVVLINQGTFNIEAGNCVHRVGIISHDDINRVPDSTMLYSANRNVYGGSFFSDLWSGLKDAGKYVVSNLPQIISTAKDVKSLLGRGKTGGRQHTKSSRKRSTKGSGLTGGAKISRSSLRKRIY